MNGIHVVLSALAVVIFAVSCAVAQQDARPEAHAKKGEADRRAWTLSRREASRWGGTPSIDVMESAPPQFAVNLSGNISEDGEVRLEKVHTNSGDTRIRAYTTTIDGKPVRTSNVWNLRILLGHVNRGSYILEIWNEDMREGKNPERVLKRSILLQAGGFGADRDDKRAWEMFVRQEWLSGMDIGLARSAPPQFFLTLRTMMPTPGWKLEVDKVHEPDTNGRIRVEITGTRPHGDGMVAQVLTEASVSARLGYVNVGEYALEIWFRTSPEAGHEPVAVVPMTATGR